MFRRLFRLDRGPAATERAVDDEIRFHVDETIATLQAQGLAPDAARREAERRFGDLRAHRTSLLAVDRQTARSRRREEWWSAIWQDLGYAVRSLRHRPGFTFGVVLTLGLGIGANATMFSVIDRLLFRPPALMQDADRVHRIYVMRQVSGREQAMSNLSYTRYLDLQRHSTAFDRFAANFSIALPIGTGESTREVAVALASASTWSFFSARPVLGRFYSDAEDQLPAGAPVVVLEYDYWQSAFGGRADVLGTSLQVGRNSYTVIGVAPRGFTGASRRQPQLFMPLTAGAGNEMSFRGEPGSYATRYSTNWLQAFAHRKPGVTQAAADADLSRAYQRSYDAERAQRPEIAAPAIARPHAIAGPILIERGPQRGANSRVATWLAGVAAVVLIITCANVANLLLARALRRRREVAVRLALGISRRRLIFQCLVESVLLALLGGLVACAVAQWGGQGLRTLLLPGVVEALDWRVLAITFTLALLAGVVTGLIPAWQVGRAT